MLGATGEGRAAMHVKTTTTPSERLTAARLVSGLDQHTMARLLRKNRNTISSWERGHTEPTISAVIRWAAITGVSLHWIAYWEDCECPGASPAHAAVGLSSPLGTADGFPKPAVRRP
jgi:transcriptional regulator with XRE-family HTH domain